MFIPDPDFFRPEPISRIQQQKKREKYLLSFLIFTSEYRFGIRKNPVPDPAPEAKKSTGSRIQIRNTNLEFRTLECMQKLDFANTLDH